MKDIINPKSRFKAQRGYVIHTRPWKYIADRYREGISWGHKVEPLLRLVESIASSTAAPQLFGATSMLDLILSDCADFRSGDSVLRITYNPKDRQFEFQHRCFSGNDDHKTCPESEGLQTLSLFLKVKFGILLEMPVVGQ